MVLASSAPHDSLPEDANNVVSDSAQLRQHDQPVENARNPSKNEKSKRSDEDNTTGGEEGQTPKKQSKAPTVARKRLGYVNETAMLGLGLCGLFVGYVVWRLADGSLSIAVAKPNIEASIGRIIGGNTQIGNLRLGWDGQSRSFMVTAKEVKATLRGHAEPILIRQVDLSLNAQSLLMGKVVVTRAAASGLQAILVVDQQGKTALGFGTQAQALALPRQKGSPPDLRRLLTVVRNILVQRDKDEVISSLSLNHASLLVLDPQSSQSLHMTNMQISSALQAGGVTIVKAAGQINDTNGLVRIAVAASENPGDKLAIATVFDQLVPAKMPASLLAGPLARFRDSTARFGGTTLIRTNGALNETVDAQGQLSLRQGLVQGIDVEEANGQFEYSGSNGTLNFSGLKAKSSHINLAQASGQIFRNKNNLQNLNVRLNSLEYLSSQFGRIFTPSASVQLTLGPDFIPVSGRVSTPSFAISKIGTTNFAGTNLDLALATNRTLPTQLVLDLKAAELRDLFPGHQTNGRNLAIRINAFRRGMGPATRYGVEQITGEASKLALSTGPISFDGNDMRFSAQGFVQTTGGGFQIPRSANVEARTFEFAIQQTDLSQAGRATGFSLTYDGLGTDQARARGAAATLVTQSLRPIRTELNGRGVAFDVVQARSAASRPSVLQAIELSLSQGNSTFSGTHLALSGRASALGLSGTTATIKRVQIANLQQLVRPFWADNLQVTGSFDRHGIELDGFSFAHNGVSLSGNTQIGFSRVRNPSINLQANIDGPFSVDTLLAAWPRRFLRETRENIRRLVPQATAEVSRLSLAIPAGLKPKEILSTSAIDLDFALRDVTVTYLPGMSPITNIAATGQLRGDRLLIEIPKGQIGGISLEQGIVEIPQFMPRGAVVNIGANISGDIAEIANEIDLPPLALLKNANMDRARLSGQGNGQLELAIPMKPNLKPQEIKVSVGADFQNAGLSGVFAGLDATHAVARLSYLDNAMSITGSTLVAGNRFAFDWASTRDEFDRSTSSLSANGDVAISSLKEVGVDIDAFAGGSAAVTVTTTSQGNQFGEGLIRADFDNARIRLPGDLWKKEATAPASSSARLYPREGGGWNLQDIRFDAQGAVLRGAVDLAQSGRLVAARFSKVMIDNAGDLSVDLTPSATGAIVSLRGAYLNLSPFLSQKNVSTQAVDIFDRPLVFSADIAKVSTSPELSLTDVHADIVRDLVGWRTFAATGQSSAGTSQIALKVERDGRRSVRGVISDAGFFAQLLYPGAPILGGTGTIEGELPVVGANSSGSLSFKGTDISFARNNTAPIIFENVELPMNVQGGVITLRNGQASGDAYTVKASGFVDIGAGQLDIRGVATPGGLNRVLAEIPLFGTILGGGEKEGLLGLTFTARGSLQTPRLRTNPISALAPGLLRKIFESEAPLSPQPRLIVTSFAGDQTPTKWPYGPTEDMSEGVHRGADDAKAGPLE